MRARTTSHLFCARRWWADMRFALTMMRAIESNRLGNRHIVVPNDPERYAGIATIPELLWWQTRRKLYGTGTET
jgi:hypothetical protein